MPVEMIGWIAPRVASEIIAPRGPPFAAKVIGAYPKKKLEEQLEPALA